MILEQQSDLSGWLLCLFRLGKKGEVEARGLGGPLAWVGLKACCLEIMSNFDFFFPLTFIGDLPGVEKRHRERQGPPLFL